VLPIFAVMSVVLLGGAALLTDVAFWWTSQLRMQRAADAAALAGAVYLPGNETLAFAAARAEAAKNGYSSGVTPLRDDDPRKLVVRIAGEVQTNFARVFCWQGGPCLDSVDVGVTSAASFVLPVPMGSPQSYYGVGRFVDAVESTANVPRVGVTMTRGPNQPLAGGAWQSPGSANDGNNGNNTFSTQVGAVQAWGGFDFSTLPDPLTITGFRVRLQDAEVSGSGTPPDCRITVRLGWDPGTGVVWSRPVQSSRLTDNDQTLFVPSASSLSAWDPPSPAPPHTWTRAEVVNTLRVELTRTGNNADCPTTREVRVGELDVEVRYDWTESVTTVNIEETDVLSPDGDVLAPQNFWGALQSRGAPNIQGDAYMPYYNTRTSATNADYAPQQYYQYGIEFPPNTTNGEIWLFDPGFCHVDADKGTGEYYTFGNPNGSSSYNDVSTYYDLWEDVNGTPLLPSDDALRYSSKDSNHYLDMRYRDTDLDVANPVSATACDDLAWHNDWVQIRSGISTTDRDGDGIEDSLIFRLHTYSTDDDDWADPPSSTYQRDTTALNAFAIWSKATGGAPRVYGLGAMEAYFPLPAGEISDFYLAQIDDVHAGKTLEIKLWDPGDTGGLAADLQILQPNGGSGEPWIPRNFSYVAEENSNAATCEGESYTTGSNVSAVTTNTGGSSRYNGCWVTITIPLDEDYSAPQDGWWKIRYIMSGDDDDQPATDLTTWQVQVIGNPVHLVME
jgi:hypothetical protein